MKFVPVERLAAEAASLAQRDPAAAISLLSEALAMLAKATREEMVDVRASIPTSGRPVG